MRVTVWGNGKMLLAQDANATIRDFYFPHVGQENHLGYTGNGIRIGVYDSSSGAFSWINHKWHKKFRYIHNTLVSDTTLSYDIMNIVIKLNSFVDHELNAFVRKITVQNNSQIEKEFRIFVAHDYNIYESPIADTAIYDPKGVIIHFKKDRYFLHAGIPHFSQFATGKTGQGYEGTWKDAEDGVLSGNLVSQGNTDSVVGFTISLKPGENKSIYYWIAAGKTYEDVVAVHKQIKEKTPQQLLEENKEYWQSWCSTDVHFHDLSGHVSDVYRRSLMTVKTHADSQGAIIASCDSDIMQFNLDHYNYCWPRDGAWIAIALDRAGFHELSRKFFRFCSKVVESGCFSHKYWSNGEKASTWHPLPSLQEDETAIVIYALHNHYLCTHDIEFLQEFYEKLVRQAADFLCNFVEAGFPKPSWDLWEERKDVHTYTVCSVIAGLKAAAGIARVLGHDDGGKKWENAAESFKSRMNILWNEEQQRYLRSKNDKIIDSSLSALYLFDVLDDEKVEKTISKVEEELHHGHGIVRYTDDWYHGHMNIWPICTLWMAQWYIRKAKNPADLERPKRIIEIIASLASDTHLLAEQYDSKTLEPKSVTPLIWSHAVFILAVHDYLRKIETLNSKS